MGEIIPSESLSRVTYTGIDYMHSQKTKQPNIRSARKNRTRPEKNKKNEPFGQLKSTVTKERRPQNKPEKRTKYIYIKIK